MDEADLIKRINKGERSLFRIFVEKYKDTSLTIAHAIVKNREEAEDVVQESFLKALQGLSKFRFRSSFKTWFYRIVVNTSYRSLEKSKVRKSTLMKDHVRNVGMSNSNAYDGLLQSERKKTIWKVLSGLKTREALLLELHYLGGQSFKEIVEITGISMSNVKVTMHRARKNFGDRLRHLIGDEINEIL